MVWILRLGWFWRFAGTVYIHRWAGSGVFRPEQRLVQNGVQD